MHDLIRQKEQCQRALDEPALYQDALTRAVKERDIVKQKMAIELEIA